MSRIIRYRFSFCLNEYDVYDDASLVKECFDDDHQRKASNVSPAHLCGLRMAHRTDMYCLSGRKFRGEGQPFYC